MAITSLSYDFFEQLLVKNKHRPVKMISAGYPDSLISQEKLQSIFGNEITEGLNYRDDSQKILKWHGLQKTLPGVYDTSEILKRIGIELSVLDITEVRGNEIICDLNEPVPKKLLEQFDIVLDAGTLEHCFNIAQTIKNFISMAKVGGHIIHLNPLFVINHGFYNLSPTFYKDFYDDNGHKLVSKLFGFTTEGIEYSAFEVPPFTRIISGIPENSWICVIAQRLNDREPAWPIQTKYKNNPTLSG